jgi:hypothetical protein
MARRIHIAIAVLATAACLSACGSGSVSSEEAGSTSDLTYQFTEKGDVNCKTGTHHFGSIEEYCAGLRSYRLNRGCAAEERKNVYGERCSSFGAWGETD